MPWRHEQKARPRRIMVTVEALKSRAKDLGFDLCGIAPAAALPELARLRQWLDRGYAGGMLYLHKSADTRADIRNVLPTARSVIVTGTLYHADAATPAPDKSDRDGLATSAAPPIGALAGHIARYAWGDDYNVVLSDRLERLVEWMRTIESQPFDAEIFVDKHHVQERVFARHAGVGWIGKNTCVINPELGSWILLAGVAVSLDLAKDTPAQDRCGSCTRCVDACPTGALVDAYELDATRCISYLTIELEGPIPESQRAAVGGHLFGCDICQDVCPWNLAPLSTLDAAWQPQAGREAVRPEELWQRSDFELHSLVDGSAMTRTTMSRLRRNLAVVLGNSGDPRASDVLDRPGGGVPRAAHSAHTPIVLDAIAWAKAQLATDIRGTRGAR